MSMSKKDFIELADKLIQCKNSPAEEFTVEDLADFCQAQNVNFKRDRWLAYIAGTCGKNGGKVKA